MQEAAADSCKQLSEYIQDVGGLPIEKKLLLLHCGDQLSKMTTLVFPSPLGIAK